ncbi:hypothetical protein GCM10023100_01320 [Actinocorallia cavernae]|uniref:Uncharacterized protein n=2 Tax=Actinomycetes TaxID=1760 RepID=A0ABP8S708_9ACTN
MAPEGSDAGTGKALWDRLPAEARAVSGFRQGTGDGQGAVNPPAVTATCTQAGADEPGDRRTVVVRGGSATAGYPPPPPPPPPVSGVWAAQWWPQPVISLSAHVVAATPPQTMHRRPINTPTTSA